MITSKLTQGKTDRALIIGGSIAGLLAARVLADYYEEVLIVDKDDLPEYPQVRSDTPQAFHPHRFTESGKIIFERFFLGYEEELLSYGAPSSLDKTIYQMNQYGSLTLQYPRNDIKFSRSLLEWVIRKRVQKIPNVHFLSKQDVICLVTNPEQTVVTGVSVRERGQIGQEETLFADMVFDTSGRTSKLAKWLEDLGYNVPEPDLLKVSLGYNTRRYKLASHQIHLTDKWDVINIAGQPANGTFTGVFSFIENHVAEVLLYRPRGCYLPVNAEEFELEISQLPSPIISEIVKEFEPITPPRGFRVSELNRHHFEKMERWPSGLLVLGDAFCIFDPIFGQGMTVAAMEAELLEICLQEQKIDPLNPILSKGFSERYRR
ncbi:MULTISPECIES: FAD-dependent oxidoreductase [Bacillus]|uniref:2-polyprenyl-6-methoxyphenol hydroxylase-like FAD-dependent oxidoreductase n=1 Tax=Bacillus capparidis TaxID=1840411 RepID=A0ABS4CV23_9BACI|nr:MULTISPECIES: FAD dependent oxidoreductase [Bacillus]MBP1081353.1 2-polyprenyl-6-methoxyphenol hydroxylase-like FAD-dependent oxidoreductase [Bacillus capparidis]